MKILNSHMFLIQKNHANGEFDVGDRRDQDPEFYPNKSSPTAAIHSVFTVLGITSVKK